jgi:GTP-binding protein
MKVNNAEFVISAVGPDQYPTDALPEIALAGRSNVGKSSLINRLINRKNLARTSSQPGKTQTLNYYRIIGEIDSLYFVDVPGYGYAKVSMSMRQQWGRMIERYIMEREALKLVLLIVDLRHQPSKDDVAMYDWLTHYDKPICVVATKADKVPRSQWHKQMKTVRETLQMRAGHPLIMFSSETGLGKDELWALLTEKAFPRANEDVQSDSPNLG